MQKLLGQNFLVALQPSIVACSQQTPGVIACAQPRMGVVNVKETYLRSRVVIARQVDSLASN